MRLNDRQNRLILFSLLMSFFFVITASAITEAKKSEISLAMNKIKLFSQLTPAEKDILETIIKMRHVKAGDVIIQQGKPVENMFITLSSKLDVKVNGKSVSVQPEKTLVGEMEYLDKLNASAEVSVQSDTDLLIINNIALTALFEKNPRIGYIIMTEIARISSQRLRDTNEK